MLNKVKFQIAFSLFSVFSAFSQQPILHPNTLEFTSEVFRDCMEYTQPQFLNEYSQQISQISIIEIPDNGRSDFPLLSSVGLKNKCNSDLKRDEINFDPSRFNPLKYFFNFNAEVIQYYQVDNTPYVISISQR